MTERTRTLLGKPIIRGENLSNCSVAGYVGARDKLVCCDLRNADFEGIDLTGTVFYGCLINGTSFVRANLRAVRFIACFSSEESLLTDFHVGIWNDVVVDGSHIDYVASRFLGDFLQWPQQTASVAAGLLSTRSDTRYNAVTSLGDHADPVVAPVLGCFLRDTEWEVRAAALRSLSKLLGRDSATWDSDFLAWVFLSLGDEHSIVREAASKLVVLLSSSDDLLRTALAGLDASDSSQQQVGLRVAISLYRANPSYARLLDRTRLKALLSASSREVRAETSHLLGLIDD